MEIVDIISNCPIEVTMQLIGKKWTIHIIRDMFRGFTKFTDYLTLNPKISTKVLSQRLKELINAGIIEKIILSETPLSIVYQLTERGLGLQSVIQALSEFSIIEYPEKVFATIASTEMTELAIIESRKRFSVITSASDYS